MSNDESWIHVQLYATYKQQDKIIAGTLLEIVSLLQKPGLINCWFFVRNDDPKLHLHLYFRAHNPTYTPAILMNVSGWCHQQVLCGLGTHYMLDTYERELEDYGGPIAIDLVEQVSSIDSTIICKIISAISTRHLTLNIMAIAVFLMDHFLEAWGLDLDQRLQWVRDQTNKHTLDKEFRPYRKFYCELLSPQEYRPNTDLMSQRELLYSLVKPEEAPLRILADQIRTLAEANALWVREEDLLKSLIHTRKTRLLALDWQKELTMYAFWRHSLESLCLRRLSKRVSTTSLIAN